jgi:hypothetical protein
VGGKQILYLISCSGKPIYGHKAILAAASPVFRAMFYGSLKEKNTEITIDDPHGSPEAFSALIQ